MPSYPSKRVLHPHVWVFKIVQNAPFQRFSTTPLYSLFSPQDFIFYCPTFPYLSYVGGIHERTWSRESGWGRNGPSFFTAIPRWSTGHGSSYGMFAYLFFFPHSWFHWILLHLFLRHHLFFILIRCFLIPFPHHLIAHLDLDFIKVWILSMSSSTHLSNLHINRFTHAFKNTVMQIPTLTSLITTLKFLERVQDPRPLSVLAAEWRSHFRCIRCSKTFICWTFSALR